MSSSRMMILPKPWGHFVGRNYDDFLRITPHAEILQLTSLLSDYRGGVGLWPEPSGLFGIVGQCLRPGGTLPWHWLHFLGFRRTSAQIVDFPDTVRADRFGGRPFSEPLEFWERKMTPIERRTSLPECVRLNPLWIGEGPTGWYSAWRKSKM